MALCVWWETCGRLYRRPTVEAASDRDHHSAHGENWQHDYFGEKVRNNKKQRCVVLYVCTHHQVAIQFSECWSNYICFDVMAYIHSGSLTVEQLGEKVVAFFVSARRVCFHFVHMSVRASVRPFVRVRVCAQQSSVTVGTTPAKLGSHTPSVPLKNANQYTVSLYT